jgi:competence protein ComEC
MSASVVRCPRPDDDWHGRTLRLGRSSVNPGSAGCSLIMFAPPDAATPRLLANPLLGPQPEPIGFTGSRRSGHGHRTRLAYDGRRRERAHIDIRAVATRADHEAVRRIPRLSRRRAVTWPSILLLIGFLALVLIVIAPVLVVVAAGFLALAWRKPQWVAPRLQHRRLDRIPPWMRASPMRFAAIVFALTLPFGATSYAITQGGDDDSPSGMAATSPTPRPEPAGDSTPIPTRTPRPTPAPRATPLPTPRPTPSPLVTSPQPTVAVEGEVAVHFLDVGQGDATLIVAPDATMLIDTGRHDRSDVVPALRSLGIGSLDVVAITHAHADHIGQLDSVLGSVEVGEVWMSGTPHTTQTFDRAITAIEQSNAGYEEPRAGDTTTVGSLTVEMLNPVSLTNDIDADMLAMRVTYGSISFLFTGDLDAAGEAAILARHGGVLSATVYQVGHHGSNTSTSPGWLAAVQPEVAIYSAGATNQYGHPHAEVIQRLNSAGIDVYGTPTHGTVTVTTDGSSFRVTTGVVAPITAPVAPPAATKAPTPAPAPVAPPPVASGCEAGQVDINSAGFDQLLLIIHIGPDRANQILSLRPFSSVDSMERISGIGPARLADIKAEGVACVP